MRRCDKLAVLIPVFNAGNHLQRTLASCATAGLPGDEYEIIIVDNCSTDGSLTGLPDVDAAGAPVHIFRNEANLGRIRNWNRAIDHALAMDFQYVAFLFAGDRWRPGSALHELLSRVRSSGVCMGFAPFLVTDGHGHTGYQSRRFQVQDEAATVCTTEDFITTMLETGAFPLGPLSANIYRIDGSRRPRFDPAAPSRADVQATLDFVQASGSVLITSAPFLEWRDTGHASGPRGPARAIEDCMEIFHAACVRTALPVKHSRGKARMVLNSLRLVWKDARVADWPQLLLVIARCSRRAPYPITPLHLVGTLWSRFAMGRRLLRFG